MSETNKPSDGTKRGPQTPEPENHRSNWLYLFGAILVIFVLTFVFQTINEPGTDAGEGSVTIESQQIEIKELQQKVDELEDNAAELNDRIDELEKAK